MIRHLFAGILLFVSFSSASAAEFSETDKCADESFKLHYRFAEHSKMLQTYSEAGKLIEREKLSNELFGILVNLKTEMSRCSDRRLPALFDKAVNFLFLTYKEDNLLALYEDFLNTSSVSSEQSAEYRDNFYRLNWQARRYEELDRIKKKFQVSDSVLAKYPEFPSKPDMSRTMLLSASFNKDGIIDIDHRNLRDDVLQVVVVVELSCDFSKNLIKEISKKPQIFENPDNTTFIIPQATNVSLTEVAMLSENSNSYAFALVNNEKVWPKKMFFHQYPTFYFIYKGEVLEHIQGWPSLAQAKLVNDTYRRLNAKINEMQVN